MTYVMDADRYRKKFEVALRDRDLYLFGAGGICNHFLLNFQYIERIRVVFDNDLKKRELVIKNIRILHSEELRSLDFRNAVFIITAEEKYFREIEEQLQKIGALYIFFFPLLEFNNDYLCSVIKRHSYDILNSDYFDIYDTDSQSIDQFKEILNDDISKEILDIILYRRRNKCLHYNDIASPDQYFPKEIFTYSQEEVMVNGGAYNGNVVNKFIKIVGSRYKKIYAFEPDPANYKKLCQNTNHEKNIVCINAGLWKNKDILRFSSLETVSSAFAEEGTCEVPVECVDDIVQEKVTFIVMDIEGAERKALEGARNTILRDKPKLAISVYHLRDDLWEIPLYLKELVPEYKFYIRHHSFTIFETVIYAVT